MKPISDILFGFGSTTLHSDASKLWGREHHLGPLYLRVFEGESANSGFDRSFFEAVYFPKKIQDS